MWITELKAIIGMWLAAQIFIFPFIITDSTENTGLVMDFGALILLIVLYFGFKFIGV